MPMGCFIVIVFTFLVVMQLRSGSIAPRGGRSIKRAVKPQAFWLSIAFEIAMMAVGSAACFSLASASPAWRREIGATPAQYG